MTPTPERTFRFGRRKGHRLKKRQAFLMSALLPGLRVPCDGPITLDTLFPFAPSEFRLEIGFGGGEHLVHEARSNPHVGFIGCEPFVNGVGKLLAAIDAHRLGNLRIHDDDAVTLLDLLPPSSFRLVHLLYPDPWPKRRHWKRRFVSPPNLDRLARILVPGGELRFATDSADYAAWTLFQTGRHDAFRWTAERAEDWLRPWPDWPGTRYEQKARRAGRRPVYLTFRRC